jgi:hypothetical protein
MSNNLDAEVLSLMSFIHCVSIAPDKPKVADIEKLKKLTRDFAKRIGEQRPGWDINTPEFQKQAQNFYRFQYKQL